MTLPQLDSIQAFGAYAGGVTRSVTLAERANGLALVVFAMAPVSGFSQTPTLGQLPMNQAPGFPIDSATARLDAWYVFDPDDGTQNLKFTNGGPADIAYTLVHLYDVDQAIGLLAPVTGTGQDASEAELVPAYPRPILALSVLAVSQLVAVVVTPADVDAQGWTTVQGAPATGVIGAGLLDVLAPRWTFDAATEWVGAAIPILPIMTAADVVGIDVAMTDRLDSQQREITAAMNAVRSLRARG